jgi:hypothetical protein
MFMQAASAGHGCNDDAAAIKVFPGMAFCRHLPTSAPTQKEKRPRNQGLLATANDQQVGA